MAGWWGTEKTLAAPVTPRLAQALLAATLLIAAPHAEAAELHGKVVGVSDGDTLTVLDAVRTTHRIRISGIDAPERRQPYGTRAKENLSALAFGKPVVVTWHKHDRYGRIVGQVRLAAAPTCSTSDCSHSVDVGLAQIESGLAWHYKRYQNEQPAEERMHYARAEELARSKRAGLWRDSQPVPPWEYRSNYRSTATDTPSSTPIM